MEPTSPEYMPLGFMGTVGFLPRYGFTGTTVLLHPPGGEEPISQSASAITLRLRCSGDSIRNSITRWAAEETLIWKIIKIRPIEVDDVDKDRKSNRFLRHASPDEGTRSTRERIRRSAVTPR
jgi:hypothetical protein